MARASTASSATPTRPTPPSASPRAEDFAAWLEHFRRRGLDPPALVFIEQTVRQNQEMRTKLEEVQETHRQLRAHHEALTAPAHYPAVITDVHQNGTLT